MDRVLDGLLSHTLNIFISLAIEVRASILD